jgi:hypothetical protein
MDHISSLKNGSQLNILPLKGNFNLSAFGVSISFPAIEIHGNAKSRRVGGKDLGLPARSRFGEGRAAPLKD